MPDAPTVIDVFAGCGGFGSGFADRGFRLTHAVEGFRTALETYVANVVVDAPVLNDVRKVDWEAVQKPDVLIGGPPCEAFTVANADRRANPLDRLYNDPVGSLTLQYVKIAKALRPRIFVMENVPPIMEGPLERELRMVFARNGYEHIHFNRIQAEDVGTPSHRDRVFISNVKLDPPKVDKQRAVMDVIGDIVSLETDIANHRLIRLGNKQQRAIESLDAGESAYKYRAGDGRMHGTWTRLAPDRLAPTIKGLGRFVHPTQPRLLTPREHARLMGYPDDYVFHGSINEQYNQVGESVPPPVSAALAAEVRRALGAS